MPTALVFAGSSFIGRPLRAALRQQGVRVVATARSTDAAHDFACDLRRADEIERVVATARPDWIVQCAGATATADPRAMYALHVHGTLAVLAAAARHVPQAHVLLFGSAAEYGLVPPERFPIDEACPPEPVTPFACSKLAQTHLAAAFAREHRLRVTTVRPFNVLGPGLPEHYFAAAVARRLLRQLEEGNRQPFAVANARATRDFVDVRDVADAVIRLLRRTGSGSEPMPIYNVASNSETTLADVATELGRLAGGLVPIDGDAHSSRGGAPRSRGDASRLRRDTGFAPVRSWQESLADLWAALTSPCRHPA